MPISTQLSKVAKSIASQIKSLSSNNIKTTSKTLGSTNKAVSGGRNVVKEGLSNTAKGVTSKANVLGKSIGVTAAVAIPAGAGIYGLDLFKNTLAHNNDYYQTKDTNKNYAAETQNLKDRLDVLDKLQNSPSVNDGATIRLLQGGGTSAPETTSTNSTPYIIGGLAIAGLIIYGVTRKKKK